MSFEETIETLGKAVDLAGVAVLIGGCVLATALALSRLVRKDMGESSFKRYRQGLGRAILLGLEILIAADIIRTVATTPSFRSVAILGIIVLIRTFLSFTLQLELEGRWPWQQRERDPSASR